MRGAVTAMSLVIFLAGSVGANAAEPVLEFQPGDHVCIIGGTFAERMQHFGWLETLIHSRLPEHKLVFRNLAFSGDEIDPAKRLRSRDFGTPDQWLSGSAPVPQVDKLSKRDEGKVLENRFEKTNTRADVIFAFFGYGESFAGEAGLPAFKSKLDEQLKHMLAQKYNGKSAPRIVLFTPIPHILTNDPNLPGDDMVAAANARLSAYAAAMKEVAAANKVPVVDLFTLVTERLKKGDLTVPLTINGIHQTDFGDRVIAELAVEQLVAAPGKPATPELLLQIRQAVNEKNWYWFNRYRVTDGYSTYGDRAFLKFSEGPGGYGDGLSNYSVGQRELEVLDVLTSNREPVIWAAASGKLVKPDDSNLPEFIPVISNKPGSLEGGLHLYLSGEEAISKMTVHPEMQVNLFADEKMFPELINPVQMAFDTRGRLWVASWPTYPHWQPTTPMADSLLILEDTDADGKADKCTTFAGDLHNITGFEFWGGGVIVAQGPDLVFLQDTNGDDRYDLKNRILHGLDTADTHHTANSFTLDPGGALYFQEGTFHHSQIETPWGPTRRVANGAVFRYEPRAQKIDVYVSFGFANPHGHVFDAWGQDIVWDGTGAQPYHAPLFSGDIDFPHKHARPPQVYQQRTRPCSGTEVLSSSHFPEALQGNLLVLNVIGFQGILQYQLADDKASFKGTEVEPIVQSSDPNFRPGDIEIGADGAIYFTDWHNAIIGHMQHNLRDPSRDKKHGRVYRVTAKNRPLAKPAKIHNASIPELLELLKSPENRVRYRTRIELSGRPAKDVLPAVKKWKASLSAAEGNYEHHRLEALWQMQSLNVVDEALLDEVLAGPDFRARAAAVRVLVAWRDRVSDPLARLQKAVNDEHPRVRLEAVRGLSFFHGEQAAKAAEIAVESLIYDQDQFLTLVLDETMKTLDRRTKEAGK